MQSSLTALSISNSVTEIPRRLASLSSNASFTLLTLLLACEALLRTTGVDCAPRSRPAFANVKGYCVAEWYRRGLLADWQSITLVGELRPSWSAEVGLTTSVRGDPPRTATLLFSL